MSDKGKYQPWYHESFMSDPRVRQMTPTAAKTYMLLLHEAFVCSTRPNLPDDEEDLRLLAWCTNPKEWASVKDSILKMFTREIVDGVPVLTNKRLTKDWEHLQEIREARSEAGKKGGLAKASKSQANSSTRQNSCSKEVSKQVGKQESEEEETDMKSDLQYELLSQNHFSRKANLRGRNGEEIKRLEVIHKTSSVIRAFGEWCAANSENPDIQDPIKSFLDEADDLLSGESPALASAKGPEVVSLVRELTYLSGGQIPFVDKQRIRLAEVLKEFSAAEITSAFTAWIAEQDLSDPKNVSFLPGKFVQIVDGLCYSVRKRKEESEKQAKARESAVARIQAEAEADREAAEVFRRKQDQLFDPLADLAV